MLMRPNKKGRTAIQCAQTVGNQAREAPLYSTWSSTSVSHTAPIVYHVPPVRVKCGGA